MPSPTVNDAPGSPDSRPPTEGIPAVLISDCAVTRLSERRAAHRRDDERPVDRDASAGYAEGQAGSAHPRRPPASGQPPAGTRQRRQPPRQPPRQPSQRATASTRTKGSSQDRRPARTSARTAAQAPGTTGPEAWAEVPRPSRRPRPPPFPREDHARENSRSRARAERRYALILRGTPEPSPRTPARPEGRCAPPGNPDPQEAKGALARPHPKNGRPSPRQETRRRAGGRGARSWHRGHCRLTGESPPPFTASGRPRPTQPPSPRPRPAPAAIPPASPAPVPPGPCP